MAIENPKAFIRLSKMLEKVDNGSRDLENWLFILKDCIGENQNSLSIMNWILNKETQLVPIRKKIIKKILFKTIRNLKNENKFILEELKRLYHFLF